MIDEGYLIAAALHTRKAFEELTAAGLDDKALPAQQASLWDEIGRLYSSDPSLEQIPRALLDPAVETRFPNPKHAKAAIEYLDSLPGNVGAESVVATYRRLRAYRVGLSLADALVKADTDEALELAAKYVQLHERGAKMHGAAAWNPRLSVDAVFDTEKTGGKIRAYPRRLNEILRGGFRAGHNVLVFGRPESGKTLVTVNCVAGMAAAGHRVLYVCNEESQAAIQARFLSRLGSTRLWYLDDSDPTRARAAYTGALARAATRGWDNLNILHDASVRLSDVPRYIEDVEPAVLVLDQIRNVGMASAKYGEDNMTRNLELASRALREWGSEYGMVTIGVAQAGGSAEGRGHLNMNDIADSKTGAPGAYDLILGVGVTEEMKLTGKRVISIVKNKVSGTETSFPIWIDAQYTAVRDSPVAVEK